MTVTIDNNQTGSLSISGMQLPAPSPRQTTADNSRAKPDMYVR